MTPFDTICVFMLGALVGVTVIELRGFFLWHRKQAQMEKALAEIRRCNADFAEAITLFDYGANEEAIEMLRRWRERAEADHG